MALPRILARLASLLATDGKVPASALASGAARTNFGAGAILQAVNGTGQGSSLVTTSQTPTATGIKVVITPSSVNSRIFVTGWCHVYKSAGLHYQAKIYRNGTDIIGGIGVGGSDNDGGTAHYDAPISLIDSPATTSAVTYEFYIYGRDATFALNLNDGGSYRSGIMAMEIAG